MNLDFFVVISNLISLFALMAVGYAAIRFGVLTPESSASFSAFLMKIAVPCTIFISLIQKEYDPAFIYDSVIIIIAGFIAYPVMLYLSRWLAVIMHVPENCRGIWASLCAFNNAGFMGFPVALALFGAEGLALSVMLNIAFNTTVFTLGAMEVGRDNPNHNAEKLNARSIIFSGVNIALVLSLIFYFGRIKLPEIISMPVNYLSGITTPLSMIIIGMALAHSHGFEVFKNKYIWLASLMKLIIFPMVLYLIVRVFPLSSNPLVNAVFILMMAMPGASITMVLCEMYHGNSELAAKILFIQNLMCIATIPLICMIIA